MPNISATLNFFRIFANPQLLSPQLELKSFNEISFPLNSKIKAIVLDKDNCFAKDGENSVYSDYEKQWSKMKQCYPKEALLIVSNSAGTNDDPGYHQAAKLEENTGITVLRHSTKKPGCHHQILDYFYSKKLITSPQEVAVIGDRLFTDVLMANMMGSYGVWLSTGVCRSQSLIVRFERALASWRS